MSNRWWNKCTWSIWITTWESCVCWGCKTALRENNQSIKWIKKQLDTFMHPISIRRSICKYRFTSLVGSLISLQTSLFLPFLIVHIRQKGGSPPCFSHFYPQKWSMSQVPFSWGMHNPLHTEKWTDRVQHHHSLVIKYQLVIGGFPRLFCTSKHLFRIFHLFSSWLRVKSLLQNALNWSSLYVNTSKSLAQQDLWKPCVGGSNWKFPLAVSSIQNALYLF